MDCFYGRLENLYCDLVHGQSFRYYDSDIFSVVSGFSDSSDRAILAEQVVILQQGYADYRERYIDRQSVSDKLESDVHVDVPLDIREVLKDIADQVNLEVAHLEYSDYMILEKSNFQAFNDKMAAVESRVDSINASVNDFNESMDSNRKTLSRLGKRLKNYKLEQVAILSIFAGIVIGCFGALLFTSSIFANIAATDPYRLVVITLLVGLILNNVIGVLIYFICRILNIRFKRRIVIDINLIIIGLLAVVFLFWVLGVVEWRNAYYAV